MDAVVKIQFVTNHYRKVWEIEDVLPWVDQSKIALQELQDFDQLKVAKHKLAQAVAELPEGSSVMIDETGLYLEGLNGFPGPYVKWMVGVSGPETIYDILNRLGDRRARAKTVIGYQHPGHGPVFFESEMGGMIVPPSQEKGYGWDSIFQPHGFSETFAEMGLDHKKMITMRKTAAQKLRRYIERKGLAKDFEPLESS